MHDVISDYASTYGPWVDLRSVGALRGLTLRNFHQLPEPSTLKSSMAQVHEVPRVDLRSVVFLCGPKLSDLHNVPPTAHTCGPDTQ